VLRATSKHGDVLSDSHRACGDRVHAADCQASMHYAGACRTSSSRALQSVSSSLLIGAEESGTRF
jgi:hypothetical protein